MRRLAVSWIVTAAVLAAAQPRRKTSPIAPQFAAPFVSPVRVGLRTGGMRRYVSLPRVLPPLASQGLWAARGVFHAHTVSLKTVQNTMQNHSKSLVQPHAPIVLMPDEYTVEAHDEYSTARTICSRYLLLRRPTAASARCRRMRCSHVVADAAPVDPSCGGAPSSFKHPALRSSFELALLRMVAEVGESSTLNVLHAASARRKITKAIEAKAKSGGAAAERALPNQSHCTKRPVPGTHSKQTKPTRW